MIAAVLLISSLLLGFVQAGGTEDKAVTNLKLGNQTIERVSTAYIWVLIGWPHRKMVSAYNNRFSGLFCFCTWAESIFSDITTPDAFNICTVYRPGLAKSVSYS